MLLRFTKMSLKAIGEITKRGDHTTAISRVKAARGLIDGNETHRNNANYLIAHFSNIFYTDKVKKCEIEPLQPETIIDTVLDYFNQTREDVFRRTKKREVTETRQIMVYFLKKYCLLSEKELAQDFGRHRSSIWNSIIKVNNYIDTDEVFRNSINDMDKTFTNMMEMQVADYGITDELHRKTA